MRRASDASPLRLNALPQENPAQRSCQVKDLTGSSKGRLFYFITNLGSSPLGEMGYGPFKQVLRMATLPKATGPIQYLMAPSSLRSPKEGG